MKHYFHAKEYANYCGYDDEYIVELDFEDPKSLIKSREELEDALEDKVADRTCSEQFEVDEEEELQITYDCEEISEEEAKKLNQENFIEIYLDDEI